MILAVLAWTALMALGVAVAIADDDPTGAIFIVGWLGGIGALSHAWTERRDA